jgi:hypothetical protein
MLKFEGCKLQHRVNPKIKFCTILVNIRGYTDSLVRILNPILFLLILLNFNHTYAHSDRNQCSKERRSLFKGMLTEKESFDI